MRHTEAPRPSSPNAPGGRALFAVLFAGLLAAGCGQSPGGPDGSVDAGSDAGADAGRAAVPDGGELVGRWRQVDNANDTLEFLPDASYRDRNIDAFEADGFQCDGRYSVEGSLVRLDVFCSDADAGRCTHVVDLVSRGTDGQVLSLSAFLAVAAPDAPVGVWRASSKRWRPVGPQLIDCRGVTLISSYDLTLTLSADAGFDFARHLEDLDPNSSDGGFRVVDSSVDGAWRPVDGGVELVNAPVLPLRLSPGPALLPGEKLFERAP